VRSAENAGSTALTTDGAALLFLASPRSAGKSPAYKSSDRDRQPWNLYRLTLKDRSVAMLASGFTEPSGTAVAGDGVLLISGVREGRRGLWRIDTGSHQVTRVADGDYGPPSLSPDGRSIVVVRRLSTSSGGYETSLMEIPMP
jgi:Tol biopolymer transport system component